MDNSLEHITALKTRPLVLDSTTDSGERGGSSLLAAWKAAGQASTHAKQQNSVLNFWWSTAAYLLAVLLDQAGYSNESQYRSSLSSLYQSLDCLPLPARHHLQNGEVS